MFSSDERRVRQRRAQLIASPSSKSLGPRSSPECWRKNFSVVPRKGEKGILGVEDSQVMRGQCLKREPVSERKLGIIYCPVM